MAIDSDPQIDWAARADGEVHALVQGTHYTRDAEKVRRAASMWALRHQLLAQTSTAPGSISIRFVPRTGKV